MSDVRPALVHLVLTKCTPGVAAYEATILDLAARGFLQISDGPDGLRVTVTARPAAGLAGYEQQVLGDVRARLADAPGAPFAALAGACGTDVDGTWSPFREKLIADGRRLGICRRNLWARPAGILFLFLISILAAITVAVAARLIWHVSIGAAVMIGVLSWFVLAKLLETLGADVLTAAGAALAAQWQQERAVLAALITTSTALRWATVPVTLAFLAVAAFLVFLGMGTVSRRSAMPKTAAFDGQVIARWQERVQDSEGTGIVRCTAIDDGARTWIFTESHVYAMAAVGDLVRVTFSPRTGQLQRVTVTARPRTERGGGPG
jgi:hypothetical protein